jgi:hypothetical protein
LQAVEALAVGFCANLRLSAESRSDTIHEVRSVLDTLGGERNQDHFARIQEIRLYAVAVVACFLSGLRWGWKSGWILLLLSAAILVAILWWR